ncbi:hypothetical protein M8J77_016335 [Diaphorina citri]|nr:hypothetical protein M8J77_016335 [Diaphorina citri]
MEAQTRPFPHKKSNEDDWVCADTACGNINFAWRTSCNRCSKEKVGGSSSGSSGSKKKLGHEIGKVIAEKSHGLFSPDDWQCNKCGNVNWARRSQCNMCNAPKFGEVEERTGLGGGYNERGVVEYKQRAERDDDDEYDDFGRRKKRRNPGSSIHSEDSYQGALGSNKDENNEEEEEEEEEEDDEEEEEGDDEDLSKYDLSGWGDDETEDKEDKSNKEESKEESKEERDERRSQNKRSRSRSRSPIHRKN